MILKNSKTVRVKNQVTENDIDDQVTRAVNGAVMTVENRLHDAILTAIDKAVITRVEMAVKSTTSSAGHGTNSGVPNPDRWNFFGNIRTTPLMSDSSWFDSDKELNSNDETRKDVDFKDVDFPALKPNYSRKVITW